MIIHRRIPDRLANIRFLAFLVGLLTFLVYLPALENGFVSWDDNLYIYDNDHIRHLNGEFFRWAFTEFHASNWHPLTWISHAIDYAIWGLNSFGHHLTNSVLHSVNTILVVLFTYHLLMSLPKTEQGLIFYQKNLVFISFVTGILFGLHPIHVESVAWISERKDLLCAFFYLLSLLVYLRICRNPHDRVNTGRSYFNSNYYFCLALFVLALLSKPMAVSLPFVLLLMDWLYSEKSGYKWWVNMLSAKLPFFLLAVASAVLTVIAQNSGDAITTLTQAPILDRVWVASYALVAYLQKIVWPTDLQPFYAYPLSIQWFSAQYLGSALLVSAVSLIALFNLKQRRYLAVAWAYYVVTLIPVLGLVKVGGQAMADRYTYLPSIAILILLSIAMVWLVSQFSNRKTKVAINSIPIGIVIIALITTLSSLTQKQIRIWENGETLWTYQLQYNDRVPIAYRQLGLALFERGEYAEAANMMSRALQFNPLDGELLNDLAICHLELGNLDTATQLVNNALSIDANNLFALNTQGEIFLAKQKYPEANEVFFRAMKMEPWKPLRLFNLAVSFDKLEDWSQACIYWRRYMIVDVTEEYDAEIIAHLTDIGCPIVKP